MNPWSFLRERYTVTSDPLRSERRIELVVLVLAVLFGFQLLYSLVRLTIAPGPDAVPPAEDALRFGSIQPGRAVVQGESEEIRARPLFWPSRRPQDAPEQTTEAETEDAVAGELKGVKLQGVFGSGETAGVIALVKDKKQRILLGEKLQGWTLETVSPNRVTLTSGERSQELVLKAAAVVAADPPPQPARPEAGKKDGAGESGEGSGAAAAQPPAVKPPEPERRGVSRR